MTLILKSDKTAVNYISDTAGVRETDYYISADLVNSVYTIDKNKQNFDDVFVFTSATPTHVIKDGEMISLAKDIATLQSPNGEKGLWAQPRSAQNELGTGVYRKNMTITIPSIRIGKTYSLQVWGSGFVKIEGDAVVTGLTYAKQGALTTFVATGNGVVSFVVSGDIDYYQVQHLYTNMYQQPAPTIYPDTDIGIKNTLVSQLSGEPFCMLLRCKSFYELLVNSAAVLEINGTNLVSLYLDSEHNLNIRMRNNGIDAGFTATISVDRDFSVVIGYGNQGLISAYINGTLVGQVQSNPDLSVTSINIAEFKNWGVGLQKFNGIFKNITFYKKNMSLAEMKQLSKSFKW